MPSSPIDSRTPPPVTVTVTRNVMPIRCLVVDDQPEFLEAVRHLLDGQGSTYPKDDLVGALPTGSTIGFVSKTDLSATTIRTALGLTPDDETPG